MYHVVLIGKDGFTREEERMFPCEQIPPKIYTCSKRQVEMHTHKYFECTLGIRVFNFCKNFWAFGCNIVVYEEE